ncbi:MAG: 50S ribosomal protein L35 [Candidatus Peregrinibacteria bacterium]|nr:50S ribosomal protein L35 [Candidatus Peregrinibacteria bacterium]
MKQKTHSGTKKRTKITGSGKVMFQKSCKNHLLSSKSDRQKKASRLGVVAPKGAMNSLKKLLNIGK